MRLIDAHQFYEDKYLMLNGYPYITFEDIEYAQEIDAIPVSFIKDFVKQKPHATIRSLMMAARKAGIIKR